MITLALTTLVVISISAACSLCEAVLYSVPATHIEALQQEGRSSGDVLAKLKAQIDRPITAILTMNTVANTAGAAVCGALASEALSEGNVLLYSAALTLVILLFSEIVPKTVGVVYARGLAPLLAHPIAAGVFVLTPVVVVISLLTRLVSRGAEAPKVSQEEIASLARLGERSGAIDQDEAKVIENVLNLPDRMVRSIMTPRTVVVALDADRTVGEVLTVNPGMMHSRIPVWEGEVDHVIGMVFHRDLLALESNEGHRKVRELVRAVDFIGDQEPVDQVLEILLKRKKHLLVVLNEFGGFSGVVTLEDVMEEILGLEIIDEFDDVADMRELAVERREQAIRRMKARVDQPRGA
jgi:CBS domain containing-hemolysin-like protein